MTQYNTPAGGDVASAARKIEDVSRRLEKLASSARRKNVIILLASLAIASFVAFNFWRAYREITAAAQPKTVANYAQGLIQGYLDETTPELEQQLTSRAPEVVNQLETRVRTMPDMFANQLKEQTKANMAKYMPELEKELVGAINVGLVNAKTRMEEMPGKTQEEKARNFLKDLGTVYGDELIRSVDAFREKYAAGAKDIIAHMDHLATNKGLTQEEQYQREAIRKFLALAEHFQDISGKVDPTRMGIHSDQANIPGTK